MVPTVMGAAFQVDPARFDPPLLILVSFVSSARIISVTATRQIRLCLDAALIVLFVVILDYRLRFNGNAVLRCECVCGCGYQRFSLG